MKSNNELTPELKKAAEEVKDYYKSNPLVKLSFAAAAWSFLAFVENYMLIRTMQIGGIQELHSLASEFSCELGHSLWWLFDTCKSEGQVPFAFDNSLYEASSSLSTVY